MIDVLTDWCDAFTDDEWDAFIAQDSFLAFAQRINARYQTAPHIELIAQTLEAVERGDLDRVIFTLPPRHSKSMTVSETFPVWFLARNPDRRVIGAAHTDFLSYTFSRRARNKLASPRWPFPHVRIAKDLGNIKSWDIEGHRGGYIAVGIGSGVAGHGADLFLVDDPIKNPADAMSELVRQKQWEWFTEVAVERLEPGGRIIIVSTRWHEDDLIGRVLASPEAPQWAVIHLDAICDQDHDPLGRALGEPLWPDRFSLTELERKRREINDERVWQSQYQGRPTTPEGGTWKRWWFRFWHKPGEPLPPPLLRGPKGEIYQGIVHPLPAAFDSGLQTWDMTFKQTSDGSWVCGQVWGRTAADCFLVDEYRERVNFPDACGAVTMMHQRWPFAISKLVEDKANGPAVVSTLQSLIPGLEEVSPRGSKEERAAAVSPMIRGGNVYLPHPLIASWVNEWIEEAAGFPFKKDKDRVDAASQGLLRLYAEQHAGGYSYSYLDQPGAAVEPDRYRPLAALPGWAR